MFQSKWRWDVEERQHDSNCSLRLQLWRARRILQNATKKNKLNFCVFQVSTEIYFNREQQKDRNFIWACWRRALRSFHSLAHSFLLICDLESALTAADSNRMKAKKPRVTGHNNIICVSLNTESLPVTHSLSHSLLLSRSVIISDKSSLWARLNQLLESTEMYGIWHDFGYGYETYRMRTVHDARLLLNRWLNEYSIEYAVLHVQWASFEHVCSLLSHIHMRKNVYRYIFNSFI